MMMSPTGAASSAPSTASSVYYPTVCRSDELLSCAKTYVKMTQRQHAHSNGNSAATGANGDGSDGWWTHYSTADMHLYPIQYAATSTATSVLEDGLALLRTMEGELKQLESLVRRRGHTNDPTEEITLAVKRLEADTKELLTLIQTMIPPTARGQWRKHWEMLQQWFQSVAQKQGERLKEILKVRGKVLEEQQQRRKRFQASAQTRTTSAAYQDNPLFQIPKHKPAVANRNVGNGGTQSVNGDSSQSFPPAAARSAPSTGAALTLAAAQPTSNEHAPSSQQQMHRPPSTAGGYYAASNGSAAYGSSSAAGYGGAAASSYYGGGGGGGGLQQASGMRQRRVGQQRQLHDNSNNNNQQQQQDNQTQFLLQQQQEQRATQQRLHEARHAERSLAELGTLFGKMSSLITQQSEVIDNIEDDVEAACVDVTAGHAEITTLYSIKKGNRALILKVFGLLIFFIIFMRFYAKK